MGTVILLNGVSSAGKSSLARALQEEAVATFLVVAVDDFIGMLPPGRELEPDWFPLRTFETPAGPLPRFESGSSGALLLAEMRDLVARLAAGGMNLIVDEVGEAEAIADYRMRLRGAQILVVKVDAPLAIIEQRERERGDRLIGLARAQAGFLHRGIDYDMAVDTGAAAPHVLAQDILTRLAP